MLVIIQALFQVKDNLSKGLGKEATDAELAQATNQTIFQVRRQIQVGQAAKNKLIKVTNILIFLRHFSAESLFVCSLSKYQLCLCLSESRLQKRMSIFAFMCSKLNKSCEKVNSPVQFFCSIIFGLFCSR